MIIFPSWVAHQGFIGKFAEFQAHRWQPTGLMYVASVIREAGHEVKLLDGAFINHDDILKQVKQDTEIHFVATPHNMGFEVFVPEERKESSQIRHGILNNSTCHICGGCAWEVEEGETDERGYTQISSTLLTNPEGPICSKCQDKIIRGDHD